MQRRNNVEQDGNDDGRNEDEEKDEEADALFSVAVLVRFCKLDVLNGLFDLHGRRIHVRLHAIDGLSLLHNKPGEVAHDAVNGDGLLCNGGGLLPSLLRCAAEKGEGQDGAAKAKGSGGQTFFG